MAADKQPAPLSPQGKEAVRLAGLGYKVVPCYGIHPKSRRCACGDAKCKSPGKHPCNEHGVTDATSDLAQVERWWRQWPSANPALATGKYADGKHLLVIDNDPRHGGEEALAALEAELGRLPESVEVISGGAGRHTYLWSEEEIKNSASLLGPGIDVRGTGGYVMLPPSEHQSGQSYAWEIDHALGQHPVAPIPAAWLARLRKAKRTPRPATAGAPDRVIEGGRNMHLASLAGAMRRKGASETVLLAALLAENTDRCAPPLDEAEVSVIAKSVARYEPADAWKASTAPRGATGGPSAEPPPSGPPTSAASPGGGQGPPQASGRAPKRSKPQQLVELLQPLPFFRNTTGRLFLERQGEALPCDGERYTELVASLFWGAAKDVVGQSAIEDATRVIAGAAPRDVPTPIRVAGDARRLVLDLGAGAPWVVTAETVDVLEEMGSPREEEPRGPLVPPVFFRPDGSAQLPRPTLALSDEESAAAFADLRAVLGVTDDVTWACCLAWLVACLRPLGPYPILVVRGEKGSGKTTLSKALRRFVDPRQPELKALPKGQDAVRTLAISAEHAHIVGFDNLSHLDAELSDALCRLSTGDGFEARKLWKGRALDVFVACRPILLNGISDAASRADLLDRSLLPPRLPAREQGDDDDRIRAQIDALAPRVLGALLWACHRAMGRVDEVQVHGAIRMRAAARWGEAAAPALGLPPGAIVGAYLQSRAEATGLDAEDPVAAALLDWLAGKALGASEWVWKGPAAQLLDTLTAYAYPSRRPPASWPETGKGMGSRLDRIEGTLRAGGVKVEKGDQVGRGHGGVRLIQLTYTRPQETPAPQEAFDG